MGTTYNIQDTIYLVVKRRTWLELDPDPRIMSVKAARQDHQDLT